MGSTNVVPDFDLSYWQGQGWSTTKPTTSTPAPTPAPTPTNNQPTSNRSVLFSAYGQTIYNDATKSLITAPDGSGRQAVKWTNPDGSYVWETVDGNNVQNYASQYYKATAQTSNNNDLIANSLKNATNNKVNVDNGTVPSVSIGISPEEANTYRNAGYTINGNTATYTKQNNTPTTTPTTTSNYVYGSNSLNSKANNAAVNTLYNAYFGRDATAAELKNWGEQGGADTTVKALEDFLKGERQSAIDRGVTNLPPIKTLEQITNPTTPPVATPPTGESDKIIYKKGNDLYVKNGNIFYKIPDQKTLENLVFQQGYKDTRAEVPANAEIGGINVAPPTGTPGDTTDKKIYKRGSDLYIKTGDKFYKIPDPATLYDLVTNKGYQDVRENLPTEASIGDFGEQPEEVPEETQDLTDLFGSMISLDPFLQEQLSDPTLKAQFDSLDPSLKMQYLMNLKALKESIEAGQIVNPDLEITEEQTKAFEDQARERIAGYYDELIGYETGDLKTKLERMKEDFTTGVGRAEEALQERLKTQTEAEAQAGLAFGSERGARMSKTIKAQQEGLNDASLEMARTQQDLARAAERRIGSDAFSKLGFDYSTPQYGASTGVNEYGQISQSGTRSLFTPSGNLVGEIPKQREVDVINERNNLILAEKQKRILDNSKLSGAPITNYSTLIETPKATVPQASASYITLPNGQRISNLDPNYSEYKRQYNL